MYGLSIVFLASTFLATFALPGSPRNHDHFSFNGFSGHNPEDDRKVNDVGRVGFPSRDGAWNNNVNSGLWGDDRSAPSSPFGKDTGNPFIDNKRFTPRPAVSRFPGMEPHRSVMHPGVVADMDSRRQGPDRHHTNSLPDQPKLAENPFVGCERHPINQETAEVVANNHYQTKPKPMDHQSIMAVYPMLDSNIPMQLTIRMPDREYQAHIEGSIVELLRCLPGATPDMCEVESETSSKSGSKLIDANKWNYIYSQFVDNSISIGINQKAQVMSMTSIPPEQIEDAEWLITSGDVTRDSQGSSGNPFLVQYPCSEYVAQHLPPLPTTSPFLPRSDPPYSEHPWHAPSTPTPHHPHPTGAPVVDISTPTPQEGGSLTPSHVVIIVVVSLLLVAALAAMAVSVYRRRNKFKVNESTPLSDQLQQQQQ